MTGKLACLVVALVEVRRRYLDDATSRRYTSTKTQPDLLNHSHDTNMKKLLLAILIVMSIVLAQVAFAGTFSDAAEAWFQKTCVTGKRAPTGINAAVCDLRERVLTLEATQPP